VRFLYLVALVRGIIVGGLATMGARRAPVVYFHGTLEALSFFGAPLSVYYLRLLSNTNLLIAQVIYLFFLLLIGGAFELRIIITVTQLFQANEAPVEGEFVDGEQRLLQEAYNPRGWGEWLAGPTRACEKVVDWIPQTFLQDEFMAADAQGNGRAD